MFDYGGSFSWFKSFVVLSFVLSFMACDKIWPFFILHEKYRSSSRTTYLISNFDSPFVTLPHRHINEENPRRNVTIVYFFLSSDSSHNKREIEGKDMSPISLYKEIYLLWDMRCAQAGYVIVLSVSIFFELRFVCSDLPTLSLWR